MGDGCPYPASRTAGIVAGLGAPGGFGQKLLMQTLGIHFDPQYQWQALDIVANIA
jgi:hypothetical protein